jgi:hypothetical protein
MSTGKRKIIQKFIHQKFACNRREHMFYAYIPPYCYECKDEIESEQHILQCKQCEVRRELRESYMRNLMILLEESGSDESVLKVLNKCLWAWLYKSNPISGKDVYQIQDMLLKKAVEEQTQIGWKQWFNGRMARSWGREIPRTYTTRKQQNDPQNEEWGKAIVLLSWELVIDSCFA